jgi:hypothetical protein
MFENSFKNVVKYMFKNIVALREMFFLILFAMVIFVFGSVVVRINSFKNINEINLFDSKYDVERIEENLLKGLDNDEFINGRLKNKIITRMYYNNCIDVILKKLIIGKARCVKKANKIKNDIYDNGSFFPVLFEVKDVSKLKGEDNGFTYDNTWGAKRNYGGDRVHEGIDIMYGKNKRDEVPIVSISDGIVVKKGWLNLGGYRLYIKASDKLYFYYAHLSSYENGIKEGEKVYAGQILGYMGDTGYGKEGTKGKFPVHLHLGMYYKDDKGKDRALNPYFLLKFLENYKLYYQN